MAPDQRPPETLPEPWLFDTEALIRELNRCRELVLLIPARTNDVHLRQNTAIGALWTLREQIRLSTEKARDNGNAAPPQPFPSVRNSATTRGLRCGQSMHTGAPDERVASHGQV